MFFSSRAVPEVLVDAAGAEDDSSSVGAAGGGGGAAAAAASIGGSSAVGSSNSSEPEWQVLALEEGEVVLQVPTNPEEFDEWLAWLLETTTPSASKADDAAATGTGGDLESAGSSDTAAAAGAEAGAPAITGGGAGSAADGAGSAGAGAAGAAGAGAEGSKSSSDRAAETLQQWNECNQRIAYHFCHYKLAQQAIVEPYNIRSGHGHGRHFDPDIADRTMIIHKMLTEVRAFAERVSNAAKQRLIRINRDVSVFSQQIKHTKDGMANVKRQLDQVLNFEGRTALGPPTTAAGRGSQRKRPLKPRSQAAREQRDQIEHAKNVRAQCERDQTSFYQTYLSQISQIVAKEPIKLVNTQISESMDKLAHKVQRLLQRAEPISNERLKDIVENSAFKSYFEYQSNLLVHHAKMLKRKLSDRDEIFASLCGYTRVDPLLQAVKNAAEHIMQKEAGKLKVAQQKREKEEADGKALRESETLLEAEKEEKARSKAKEEKRKAKQAETERKRLEAEAKIKLEKEAARRAKEEADAAAHAAEERKEEQRLEQRRKEREKELRERRAREKKETEQAMRSATTNAVSDFLNTVEASVKVAPRISGTKEVGPPAAAVAAAAAAAAAAVADDADEEGAPAPPLPSTAPEVKALPLPKPVSKSGGKKLQPSRAAATSSAKAAAAAAAEEKTAGSDSGVELGAAAVGQAVEDGPWEEPKKKRKPAVGPTAGNSIPAGSSATLSSTSRKGRGVGDGSDGGGSGPGKTASSGRQSKGKGRGGGAGAAGAAGAGGEKQISSSKQQGGGGGDGAGGKQGNRRNGNGKPLSSAQGAKIDRSSEAQFPSLGGKRSSAAVAAAVATLPGPAAAAVVAKGTSGSAAASTAAAAAPTTAAPPTPTTVPPTAVPASGGELPVPVSADDGEESVATAENPSSATLELAEEESTAETPPAATMEKAGGTAEAAAAASSASSSPLLASSASTVMESMVTLFAHLAENGAGPLADLVAHASDEALQGIGADAEGRSAKAALEATCEMICRSQYDPNEGDGSGAKMARYPYCFAQGSRCCAHVALGIAAAFKTGPRQSAVMSCSPGLAVVGSDLVGLQQPVTAEDFLRCAAGVREGTVAKIAALPAALMVTIEWESGGGGADASAAAVVAGSIPRTVDLHTVYHRWGDAAQTEAGIYTLASVTCNSSDDMKNYTRYQSETSSATDAWLQVSSADGVQPSPVGAWSDVVAALAGAKSSKPTVLAYRRATYLPNV